MLTEQEKNDVNAAVQGAFIFDICWYLRAGSSACYLHNLNTRTWDTPVEACLLGEISKITLPLVEEQAKMVSIY